MEQQLQNLCDKFNIEGKFAGYKIFTSGHINSTALVEFQTGTLKKERYVLQKINKNVFKNPEEVMENIVSTTSFIKNKLVSNGINPERRVLEFLKSSNGKYFVVDENGDYWRMYKYIDKSTTFDATADLKILEETGKAFGEFQHLLDGFNAEDLNIIIPHFHNTVNRYKIFKETVRENKTQRVFSVVAEIKNYLDLQEYATKMYQMQKEGALPLRVTHNDTKCNNVLFDKKTGNYLCAIDLDTIMPGLVGFDFGDAVRFAASTAAEDERDLEKVTLSLKKFEAITKGFLETAGGSLTKNEIATLPLGAITMTTECGLRFLTDYIDGDNYFKISYPTHNLDRARCQLKLAQEMILYYKDMCDIVEKYANQNAGEQE